MKQLKFNRGDVAEGILGAALTAKFINRPKSLKDADVKLTKKMVDDVLDDILGSSNKFKSYNVKDILSKTIYDKISFSMRISTASYNLLEQKNKREIVHDLYESAIMYVEETWKKDVLAFAMDGQIDDVVISSDGIGDQKGTKADIKVTINGKSYSRQISLKVKGGEQFAQISGHEFDKQISLWEDILKLNIKHLRKKYEDALENYDKSELFSARENERIESIRDMMKNAADITYRDACRQINLLISSNNKAFLTNLTNFIFHGITKGDKTIELVKLEGRKFKQLKFNDDFVKTYANQLKTGGIKALYKYSGYPQIKIYVGTPSPKTLLLTIRPRIVAESRVLKQGKVYSPYFRNIVEGGPVMFSLG